MSDQTFGRDARRAWDEMNRDPDRETDDVITKWYSLPLHVGQHHVTDIDVKYELTYRRGRGFFPMLCYISGDAGALVALSFGAADLGTVARLVTDTAWREWEVHGEAILDDAGLLEHEYQERPHYTGREYHPIGLTVA